jgi:hypothetical protein
LGAKCPIHPLFFCRKVRRKAACYCLIEKKAVPLRTETNSVDFILTFNI